MGNYWADFLRDLADKVDRGQAAVGISTSLCESGLLRPRHLEHEIRVIEDPDVNLYGVQLPD